MEPKHEQLFSVTLSYLKHFDPIQSVSYYNPETGAYRTHMENTKGGSSWGMDMNYDCALNDDWTWTNKLKTSLSDAYRWSPTNFFTLNYNGEFMAAQSEVVGSSNLPLLWNMLQTVSLNLGFPVFNATFSLDYYRNELAEHQFSNLWLGNLDLNWKASKKTRLTFGVHNLFNNKLYQETYYGSASTTQQWVRLRSREFFLQLNVNL